MKKLNLDVSALRVESFETAAHGLEGGTVHAHSVALTAGPETCAQAECQSTQANYTCLLTLNGTCEPQTRPLGACGPSAQCTWNAGDLGCYNSLNFCVDTQLTCADLSCVIC
jgi:hypothetical protein